MENKKLIFIII